MDLEALRNRVYTHLRDRDHNFYETDIVDGWLNDGYVDVVARLRSRTTSLAGVFADGDGTFAIPADYVATVSLRFGSDDQDAQFVDDPTWNAYYDEALTAGYTFVRAFGGLIETYPAVADGETYVLRYYSVPSGDDLLVEDTDEPVLSFVHQPLLTYYALAQAYMQMDNSSDADRWLARYEAPLPAAPTGREQELETMATRTFELGPFDTDMEARHI